MAEYYVVLGDVVHSREIEDREAFQERLAGTCGRFTAASRDDVYGDFKILKGVDEFGGVLQSLENLYDVVTEFQDALYPHGVRMVVASGSIDVGLTTFDVERMDGEAFHRASKRLEEIEDGPLSFDLLVEDEHLGRAIADEVNLLLRRRAEWTDRQREVIEVRREVETQAAAAERLGVTQQAVSNVLSGADWPLVETVEERLGETLAAHARSRMRQDSTGETRSSSYDPFERSGSRRREWVRGSPTGGVGRTGTSIGGAGTSEPATGEADRLSADHGDVVETLAEYERVLDVDPGNVTAYFEYAALAVGADRHDEALVRLSALLDATIDAGRGTELVGAVHERLDDVVEPLLANATDRERAEAVLELLTALAERTTGAASEDLRLWSYASFARWFEVPHERAYPDADGTAGRVVDAYSTGLGFLLADEPETAVQFFRRAWASREESSGADRGYALSAGVGLLGCAELLGPSILDDDPDAIRRELVDEDDALRAPGRRFLERLDVGATGDVAGSVHDDDHEQFSKLEAEAFAALYAQLHREWNA